MKTKINGILTLLLAFMVQITFAQERTISGVVSDDMGPIQDISVKVKGTTSGTVTDFDGNYAVKAKTGDVLVFSHVSYTNVEEVVSASSTVSVTMSASGNDLDEVVVTAYGIKRQKKTLTYVAEKVTSKDLLVASPNSAAEALAGKVAGLQINIQDNGVNPTTQVLLRGLRSISQGNTALFVIDGSIASQGAFDALNPNDIENMNILKGANAAALYGSRAGNGAVIITTRRGKKSSLKIGVNTNINFEKVAYMPEFQTEYGTGWQGVYDAVENTNWGPRFDGTVRQIGPTFADGTFQAVPYAPVKDNLKNFYKTGFSTNSTVYASGGTENSKMYVSIGNRDNKGIVPEDTYSRNSAKVNASTKINKLTLGLNTNFMKDETSLTARNIGDQNRDLYWFILNTSANIPLANYEDWENDLYSSPDGYYNAYYQNPYWAIDTNRDNDKSLRSTANFSVAYEATSWLDLTTRFGVNSVSGSGKEWRASQVYNDALQPAHSDVSSYVVDSEFQSIQTSVDFIGSSKFKIKDNFDLSVVVGASSFDSDFRSSSLRANNLLIDGFYDISNGEAQNLNQSARKKRTYGFFGDASLTYKEYLTLYMSGRQDWTSTLSDGENSYFYPSFGVSFVFTDGISALKDNDFLNFGKLTLSNSTVYNDAGVYAINERFQQSGTFPFPGINGFFQSGTAVDDLIKKEKLNTTEIGLNLSFWDRRINTDLSFYRTITNDLITNVTSAPSSGSAGFLTNIGELESDGLELTFGVKILRDSDFKWDFNVNYATNKTIVNEINDPTVDNEEVALTTFHNMGIYAVEGQEYPQIKGSSYMRDPQGRVVIDAASGNPIIDTYKKLGRTTPKHTFGFTNAFSYKGISLRATLDYRTGHHYYSQIADFMEFTGRSMASVSSNREDFVWPNSSIETSPGVFVPNTSTEISGGKQNFWTNHYNEIAENYAIDATALKLREIALDYSLPKKLFKKIAVSNVTLGVNARNLATWLPKANKFADPEFNNSNSNAIGIGGFIQSPPTRNFGFKLNVEF